MIDSIDLLQILYISKSSLKLQSVEPYTNHPPSHFLFNPQFFISESL